MNIRIFTSLALAVAAILSGCDTRGMRYVARVERVAARYAQLADTVAGKPALGDSLLVQSVLSGAPSQVLWRVGYVASYNSETRLPNWVAWRLTAERAGGRLSRKGVEFREDGQVPQPRADDWDYYDSGFDRGHMCPAADNKWSRKAMEHSFLFTNVCPQSPGLNRGDWNELEMACRKWARHHGDIYIVCGPVLYNRKHKTIGKHRVVVPEAFFKVVLFLGGKPKAIGFVYKNAPGNRPKGDYVNTVDEVERITGIDLFPSLPDGIESAVETRADMADWQW